MEQYEPKWNKIKQFYHYKLKRDKINPHYHEKQNEVSGIKTRQNNLSWTNVHGQQMDICSESAGELDQIILVVI